MAAFFFDSSALAKRYVSETGSRWVQSLADSSAGHEVYVARITLVELVAAITRRKLQGDLTPQDEAEALADLRADFASDYLPIEITATLLAQAEALAEKHALRGYDAVQLAAALQVSTALLGAGGAPLTLVSADLELNAAAQAEGLSVDDPNTH